MKLYEKFKYFYAKTKNHGSVFSALRSVTQTKIVTFILNQITTLILVRYLSKSDYGKIAICTSIFALIELGIQIFDSAIVRFYPTINHGRRLALVNTVIWLKFSLAILSILAMAAIIAIFPTFGETYSIFQYSVIIYLNLANLVLSIPRDSFEKVLNAQFKYKSIFVLSTISSLNGLIGVCLLILFNGTWQHFFIYKLSETILVLITATYFIWQSEKLILVYTTRLRWALFKKTYSKFIHKYCLPLGAASLSTYVKNYAPTFVAGSVSGLDALGTANVLTNIVRTFHKGTQDIFDRMMPLLFKKQSDNPQVFEKLYTSYFIKGLILRCAVILFFIIFSPIIFRLYTVEFNKTNFLLYELLLAEFGLVYFISVTNYLILSRTNMMAMLWASLSRNLIGFALTILFVKLFGIVGLPAGFLISALLSLLLNIRQTRYFQTFHNKALKFLFIFILFSTFQFYLAFVITS
jgi:O-antigen/teichoic acid export membrane protein